MVVYCPACEALVQTEKLSSHEKFNVDYDFAPMRYSLLKCTACNEIQLVEQYLVGYEPENEDHWSSAKRNWPLPELELPLHVPAVTKKSIEEAERCLRAKAFTACTVMTGRALEGICRHYATSSRYLGAGIKELKEQGVIDEKLFEWSEALHLHRNIAAHADERTITEEDARDLMDFTIAICEYIFVLSEKFKDFKARQNS
ncbi:DUF4145 domain-containing protein [Thiomicrorhabdus heinhorstiae]|uniref:DUF4145 domain-containing protein n=1 Tax=Thiomicrorhabdus heinhorstiae TaxID=2748010 RepID=A0ABS0C369_9GAMM|nr:DUF4145 domain-containing protein [Thiomicrorhabdus heinhorstiae]MBF6058591.1 DUF4145 domain-containing protein [Thiomicrorhabdus heinhorstiae]